MQLYQQWKDLESHQKKNVIKLKGEGLDWKYVADNLKVFDMFLYQVNRAHLAGRKKMSATQIVNFLRWDTYASDNGSTFKVNDHLSPLFARLTMRIFKDMEGVFEIRGG